MDDPDDPAHDWIPADAEPLDAETAWAEFATPVYCWLLEPARDDVSVALGDLVDTVHDGRRPTAEQVTEAREAIDRAREVVEDYYAELAPDVDPWDGGAGGRTPYGTMADQLRSAGYAVEYVGREAEP